MNRHERRKQAKMDKAERERPVKQPKEKFTVKKRPTHDDFPVGRHFYLTDEVAPIKQQYDLSQEMVDYLATWYGTDRFGGFMIADDDLERELIQRGLVYENPTGFYNRTDLCRDLCARMFNAVEVSD
jgi:hypothetical protein